MYFLPGLGVSAIKHFVDLGAMAMKREFMLKLNSVHVGQLPDARRIRAESAANKRRDRLVTRTLKRLGWRVVRV